MTTTEHEEKAPKPAPQCAVCKQRPAQGIVAGVPVCGQCYDEATHDEIRIWRKSLQVVRGGLPC
jgi:hypothetical protein